MTAAEIQKQALSWLRQNPGQRCCQHHWAQASGLTSPEHEQALGPLLRTIRIDRKQFSEFLVADGVCARCEATGDRSAKVVIQGDGEWKPLGRGRPGVY
jgi:hypothetical protein